MTLVPGGMLLANGHVVSLPPAQQPPAPKPSPPAPAPAPTPKPAPAPTQDVVLVTPTEKVPAPRPSETIAVAPKVNTASVPVVVASSPAVPPTKTTTVAPAPKIGTPVSTQGAPTPTPTTGAQPTPAVLLSAGASTQPLKGGSALAAIAQACSDDGVDTLACVSNALHEGASGKIGDNGIAYGPFQAHLTDGRIPDFAGLGPNDAQVNAWAWSQAGIEYAVRAMVNGTPSAKGLTGHAAVEAIVRGFEKPADEASAITTRNAEYDKLVSLGAAWATYAASLLKGPIGGGAIDTNPIVPSPASGGGAGAQATGSASSATTKPPAALNSGWKLLLSVFSSNVPKAATRMQNSGSTLLSAVGGTAAGVNPSTQPGSIPGSEAIF